MSLDRIAMTLERSVTVPRGRQRPLRMIATNLSLAAAATATLVVVYDALAATLTLLYERDAAGGWVNVDPVDGKALIPLCWGRGGHALFGLTRQERDVLRSLLVELRASPFRYDPMRRCWLVRLARCPDLATALAWLESRPITAESWRGRQRELSARLAARRR